MIDVENDVFDYVYPAVEELLPEGNFSSEYDPAPTSLPFATLIEEDNYTDNSLRGTADQEEFAVLMYEANVYATDKAQCRNIMNAIDEAMTGLGFQRISKRFVPNLADATIFRIVCRYRGGVNQDKTIFRK